MICVLKKTIKQIVCALSGLCCCLPVFSQGLINNGAAIIITAGAKVYVDGNASGNYTNQTSGGSNGQIDLNGDMYVEGNWYNNATGGSVFINNTAAPWGTVYLNGTAATDVGGTRLTEFENLYIQNANRTLQVTNCEVNNILTVDNNGMLLNQKRFIIDNSSNSGITKVGTGFVRSESTAAPFGEIQWNIGSATGSNYVIPFNTAAPTAIPFSFKPNAGTTGNMVVATYPTNPANLPYPPGVTNVNDLLGANNSAMTVDRFWELIAPGAPASADVIFICTAGEATGIPNPRAQRWLGSGWELPYQGAQSTAAIGTNVNGMVTFPTWWTLADITSPLPVELVDFSFTCEKGRTRLQWSTASETNNSFFTLEKSFNGKDFFEVGKITGAGNSNVVTNYSFTDVSQNSKGVYYKLSQTDLNGSRVELKKIFTTACADKTNESVYLIPESDNNFMVYLNSASDEVYAVTVYDISGKLIQSFSKTMTRGLNRFLLSTSHLSSAMYMVKLQSEHHLFSSKIVVNK